MSSEDALAVHELSVAAFADLGRRLHEDPHPHQPLEASLLRITHLIDTDPGGAWVADAHGRVVGAALAIMRDGLWGRDRGYAAVRGGELRLLAAVDEEAARDLLRAALATTPPGVEAAVDWITSAQAWAVEPVLDAGLELGLRGGVFLRGEVGPFRPYLPSGAYL